ncbi:hypothetical protein, partial [Paracoccus tibetensis]|uniref:hypothetical protein n=1 Tax=Paracoccus tibetensis TaxID=336292 RepID=UPI001C31CC5E
VKLTPSSSLALEGRHASFKVENRPNRPHISSDIHQCQKAEETKSRIKRQSLDAQPGHPFPKSLPVQTRASQRSPSRPLQRSRLR